MLGVGVAAGTVPVDCATSHNNNRGAVRYANPLNDDAVIAVWNLGDPSSSTPPAPMVVFGAGSVAGIKSGTATSFGGIPYLPSDRIALGTEWGVSIGSGSNGSFDENYIEVFKVSGTPLRQLHAFVRSARRPRAKNSISPVVTHTMSPSRETGRGRWSTPTTGST